MSGSRLLVRYAALWLVPLAVIVALLAAEGLLRLCPQLLPEDVQIKRLYQLQSRVKSIGDPVLGFVYPPNYRARIVSLNFDFGIESDEHGFRNATPWPDQADIVVVGDSMAYGWGVEREAAWMHLLDQQFPGSRVITLGLPGTAPQQYVRYFQRFGIGLRPKILIFAIFTGNDIVGAETFDRWIASGAPDNFDVWRFFEGRIPESRARFPETSHLLMFLKSVRKGLGETYSARTIQLADGAKLQLAPAVHQRALEYNDPLNPAFMSVVEATLAARDLATANGSDFLVMLFPTKEAVYLPLYGVPFPTLARPLKDMLEDAGVTCLDLTPGLRAHAEQGRKLFFEIDGHPNELGNRVIADILVEYLQKKSVIAALGAPPSGP